MKQQCDRPGTQSGNFNTVMTEGYIVSALRLLGLRLQVKTVY